MLDVTLFNTLILVNTTSVFHPFKKIVYFFDVQDFGSPVSGDAMYLVGGASKQPFVAYFAR